MGGHPFPRTDLACWLSDRYDQSHITVEDSDGDLDVRDLPFEVRRPQRLAKLFYKRIFVSARLWRWYLHHRRHTVRLRHRCVLTVLFQAVAPVLVGFQGLAL